MSKPLTVSPNISAVIVLAAGQGTRMRSRLPKVMHPIAGRPLLWHALAAAGAVAPEQLVVVLGHGRAEIGDYLDAARDLPPVRRAFQDQQLGTGHAVSAALATTGGVTGTVIVTYGDVPLLTAASLVALADEHHRAGNAVTVLTTTVGDPDGYGRIIRDDAGALTGIVEQRDATGEQRAIREINSGVYAFDGPLLGTALDRLTSANDQGERYLTDVVGIARADGRPVGTVHLDDPDEVEGVNDRVQLAALARRLNERIVRRHQLAGVTVQDPGSTWIHVDVAIGPDSVLLPGTSLEAGTTIGSGCTVGPETTLSACTVGDGATVLRSHCTAASIAAGARVGPYTHLRQGSDIGERAEVGAYVEVKKATLGPGVKSHHLAYLGDATIGAGTNIGAGVITANYDGARKSPTVIGDAAFIGTNATLVAPIGIGAGAYVAAGSTVTEDVPPGDLAVARGRQHSSTGWVFRRRAGSISAAAARAAGAESPTDAQDDPPPRGRDDSAPDAEGSGTGPEGRSGS
jgi:bifunctional UDP-N-acetylglucosamine pyrophosphorylase/glucosamine-1-phosphate N-acetyltransferase